MLAASAEGAAKLTVHRAFSSHMVLQAEAPVLFGTASPSSTVTVDGPDFMSHPVIADADGKWLVKLPEQHASDPKKPGIELTISDDRGAEEIKLTDVLFGDVRRCTLCLPQPAKPAAARPSTPSSWPTAAAVAARLAGVDLQRPV